MSDPFLGEIRMVGFNFAPSGWAFCQGQLMPIAQNAALFSLLGTQYGGNGQTTFGLPDLRGRSPVGMGQGAGLQPISQGEMAGVETVTLTSNQMPAHTHSAKSAAIQLTSTGSVGIPANNTSATDSNPGPATVLGPISASGRAGSLYSESPSNTTLAPFPITVSGSTTPADPSIGVSGGSQPVDIRNPYLGVNFVIALQGVFPARG